MFERFYRADQARSRRTGGTGLGLSIVKHAVQRHGGEVVLWSRPGRGSTFTIRLPADRRPARPGAAQRSASAPSGRGSRPRRPEQYPRTETPYDSRPDRRGRAGSRRPARLPPAPRGIRGRDRRGRARGAHGVPRARSRHHPARPHAARDAGHRGVPAGAGEFGRADHHADGEGLRGRHRRGARTRRRRLRHEALLVAGAARADARRAAPSVAGRVPISTSGSSRADASSSTSTATRSRSRAPRSACRSRNSSCSRC